LDAPERAVEQSLNLGAHYKLFSYLTMFVEGAGNLSLTIQHLGRAFSVPGKHQSTRGLGSKSSPHRYGSSAE
jgi:hypothetical protein